MARLEAILRRLHRNRSGLEAALEAIPEQKWNRPPRPGAWSAAEVVAHLATVEAAILDGAERMIRHHPRPTPLWQRAHWPVMMVQWRFPRQRTPVPTDPQLLASKDEMLASLAALRRRTLAFLEETRPRDLRLYRRAHPLLGSLNFYQWFDVMARHELRHTKQVREIGDSFQK